MKSLLILCILYTSLTAITAADPSVRCSAPIDAGPCRARKTRWGAKDGMCVEFVFGGCGGNANNFETRDECERACPLTTNSTDVPKVDRCDQPLVTGLCRANFPRWGSRNGVCTQFIYGGCGANENNFRTKEECEISCKPKVDSDICTLPAEAGNCYGLFSRWASVDGVCTTFTFGGCGGNANNFQTKEECERTCPLTTNSTDVPKVDRCDQPLVTGLCRANFPRWGSKDRVCTQFIYGGCGANENNFKTKEECEMNCKPRVDSGVCTLPAEPGNCYGLFSRWTSVGGVCTTFTYGGCGGNSNNFETRDECERVCPPTTNSTYVPKVDRCDQPLVTGLCRAYFPRWGSKDGVCTQFIYGGCGANENNFETKEECERACPPATNSTYVPKVDRCDQPLVTGLCRANFPRWGSKGGVCTQFIYGGCGANENNFRTKEECEISCKPKVDSDVCTLPAEAGSCYGLFSRWASVDGVCTTFTFGGCGGNANNFQTKEECERTCPATTNSTDVPKVDRCDQPLVTGLCRANFPRWGSKDGVCTQFIYGGCGANKNNFRTKEDCEEACSTSSQSTTTTTIPMNICNQPLSIGPCKGVFPRWGSKDGVCTQFTYGGCGGNQNNFGSKERCEKSCPTQITTTATTPTLGKCEQPIVPGPCFASITRWGRVWPGRCVQFTYGGCGGNENSFDSRVACESQCLGASAESVCHLPLVPGPCKAYMPSWGYKNGVCVNFIYGGCDGNENRFSTREQCRRTCYKDVKPKPRKCTNPESAKATCVPGKLRWIYDSDSNECMTKPGFSCRGRRTTIGFRSKRSCESRCKD